MSWRLAESLKTLRSQINAMYPNRDKASDGSIGDTRHKASKSDHNPNAAGVVTAIDVDEDLSSGTDAMPIVKALQASRDPRIKYIIYEGKITVKGDVTKWKPYTGSKNPHNHHFHISVSTDPKLYDDAKAWNLANALTGTVLENRTVEPFAWPTLKRGSKGKLVVLVQEKLDIKADGDFGINTENALVKFQRANGLEADGKVGPHTRKALGL